MLWASCGGRMYKLYWYISTYVHRVYIYKDISIVDVHTLPYGVVGVSRGSSAKPLVAIWQHSARRFKCPEARVRGECRARL